MLLQASTYNITSTLCAWQAWAQERADKEGTGPSYLKKSGLAY